MNTVRKFVLAILAVAIVLPVAAMPSKRKINKAMNSVVKEYQMIGATCAVVKDGQIIFVGDFGALDTAGTKFSGKHDEIYRLASVSKSYTACAVMHLVDEGKINLDDRVDKYLGVPVVNPKYPDDAITVRMFLNHTSSIRDFTNNLTLSELDPVNNPDCDKHYMDKKPGTNFHYSNLCYNLLACVVENASGERFDKYVKRTILDPLGLNASFNPKDLDSEHFIPLWHYDKVNRKFKKMPTSYKGLKVAESQYKLGVDANQFVGCGGMKTTIVDLAKYMMMHMNDGELDGVRVLSAESDKAMKCGTIVGAETATINRNYGLGLSQYEAGAWVPGKPVVGHRGQIKGLGTSMHFNQEEGWGIVTIFNGCVDNKILEGTHALVETLYGLFLAE